MNLCSPSVVRELLASHSLSPRKSLGQNFLIDPRIPELTADAARKYAEIAGGPDAPKGVIEIGPGIGALTDALSSRFDRVVSVEIDRGLADLFSETFSERENVVLVVDDFLKTDVKQLLEEHFSDILGSGGTVGVCANLPYYITTPVIMKLLESFDPSDPVPLSAITVMIQSEVADRLTAEAGSPEYGSVTASVSLRCAVRKIFDVSPGCFFPPPKVKSTVVSIIPHGGIKEIFDGAPDDREECGAFFGKVHAVIEAAFSQRRKTLTNSLSRLYSKDRIVSGLERMGLRTDIRGEKLSASDFCRLTYELIK